MTRRFLAPIAVTLALFGAPACGGSAPPASEAASARGPGDAYVAYVSAIGNAGNIGEVTPYLTSAGRKQLATDLEAMKARVPGGVLKIVDEQVAGDKATVTLTATLAQGGKEVPASGTVVMLREGGAWKVDQESWVKK